MIRKIFQFFKFIVFALYFSVLIYFICKDVKRYIDNEDSSSIAFRKFNEGPRDKYPVVTFCFSGGNEGNLFIYNEKRLLKKGLSVSRYWGMITGRENSTADEIKKLPNFHYVTMNLKKVTKYYRTLNGDMRYLKEFGLIDAPKPALNKSSLPFNVSYQNPNKICYTQRVSYKQEYIKLEDTISLDAKKLLKYKKSSDNTDRLHIYVHYQGQTIRSFGKYVFVTPITENEMKKRIEIRLSSFIILRRRVDGRISCHPNSEGDDARYRDLILKKLRCLPLYWKNFDNSSSGLGPCVSVDQLQNAFVESKYRNVGKTLSKISHPCTELSVTSSVDMRDNDNLVLNFQYRNDQYMEITNLRDFGFISLWSSSGGLIGIFLGFSMFQMSGVLLDRLYEFLTKIVEM